VAVRLNSSRGGKPDKLMRDAIILALHREAEDADGQITKKLNLVAAKLVEKAIAGDVPAIKEIADRVDGKSVQPIAGSDEDPPIIISSPRDRAKALAVLLAKAKGSAEE
jgi:hypothetical protein